MTAGNSFFVRIYNYVATVDVGYVISLRALQPSKNVVIGCARVLRMFSFCFILKISPLTFLNILSQISNVATFAFPRDFCTFDRNCFVVYSACDVVRWSSSWIKAMSSLRQADVDLVVLCRLRHICYLLWFQMEFQRMNAQHSYSNMTSQIVKLKYSRKIIPWRRNLVLAHFVT